MRMNLGFFCTAFLLLPSMAGSALAQQPAAVERRELIYCADRMSHEERETYRAKMRAARTIEEKEALRAAVADAAGQCDTVGRQWRSRDE